MRFKNLKYCVLFFSLLYIKTTGYTQTYFNRTYSMGGGAEFNSGVSAIQVGNFYYILAVSSPPPPPLRTNWQIIFSKLNLQGDTLWTKRYRKPFYTYGIGYKPFIKLRNNKFLFTAEIADTVSITSINGTMICFNMTGDTLWQKSYGDTAFNGFAESKQLKNGDIISIGVTCTYYQYGNFWLVKTDSVGNLLWQRHYLPNYAYGHSITLAKDGGYVLTGITTNNSLSPGHYKDILVIKTDSMGNVQWKKQYGGKWTDEGWSCIATADSGYVIAGGYGDSAYAANGQIMDERPWIFKIDKNGNTLWDKKYFNYDHISQGRFYNVIQAPDGSFIACGEGADSVHAYYSKLGLGSILTKTSATGDSLYFRPTYAPHPGDSAQLNRSALWNLHNTSDGGFIGAGTFFDSQNNGSEMDWLIKLDSLGCDSQDCSLPANYHPPQDSAAQELPAQAKIYPNPFGNKLYVYMPSALIKSGVSLNVFNLLGQKIFAYQPKSNYSYISTTSWAAGIYFIRYGNTEIGYKSLKMVKY